MNETMENMIQYFDWSDYSIFGIMLMISALIGIYFGCFGNKQNTADEYLYGGKQMRPLPVALSLVASSISGITLIGVPAEIYTENSTYWLLVPSLILVLIFVVNFCLPIFFELKITSVYEYLELRFDKSVRSVTSVIYCILCLLYLPSVIYVPSLSLSQVTGINMHFITTGVTFVCVFYTMIGGIKAVIWADFIQTLITIIACGAIVVIGTINVGGVSHVLTLAYENGKLNIFNMDVNPFQRSSFWIMIIGSFVSWASTITVHQSSIQRFLSLSSYKDIKFVLTIYWIGVGFLTTVSVYGGLLIYAAYDGCDPIEQKYVKQADQIFPFYVLDKIGYVPALPGLFVAGVFSAALSTLSTGLNSIAATIYVDFIKNSYNIEHKAHIIMKATVVGIGIFSVAMVFVVEKMGKILSVSYILSGVTLTPITILFTLGMMVPMANTKGAKAGALVSTAILLWIAIGSTFAKINFTKEKIYSIDTCPILSKNETLLFESSIVEEIEDDVFFLYKLSYMLYVPFGLLIGIVVGVVVSYFTGPTDLLTLDPKLISPPLRRFLPKKKVEENKYIQEKLIKEQNGPYSGGLVML